MRESDFHVPLLRDSLMPVRLLACAAILAVAVSITTGGGSCKAANIIAAGTIRTVALSGQTPPGAPTLPTFQLFRGHSINSEGKVAFRSHHNAAGDTDEIIWIERGDGLRLLARESGAAPAPNASRRFVALDGPRWLQDGEAAFNGYFNSSLDPSAAWITDGAGLRQISGLGFPVPNADGAPVPNFSWRQLHVDAAYSSQTMVLGGYARHSNGIGYLGGYWLLDDGVIRSIALQQEQAPGAPLGAKFAYLQAPVLNRHGHVVFQAELTANSYGTDLHDGIWTNRGGALDVLARSGAPATEFGADFTYRGFPRHNTAVNDAGAIVFHAHAKASLGDQTQGLVLDDGAVRRVVARSGQSAPGTQPDLTFSRLDLGAVAVNGRGQVGFSGWVSGPGVTGNGTYGLWLEKTPGNLDAIVRGGEPAPGGGLFRLDRQQPFAMNSVGQIAFGAQFTDIGGRGIWATDRQGVLHLIARSGSQIEVAPGDVRTILSVLFSHAQFSDVTTGGQDGSPSSFNDRGELAFSAIFTDGSEGLFVSKAVAVPEPATIAVGLLGVLATTCGGRRRRKSL